MHRRNQKTRESPQRNLNKRKYGGGAINTAKRLRSSHPCLICEQVFPSLPDLRTHLSSAHPKEKLPCQECGKFFATHTSYINHPCKKEPKRSLPEKGFYDLMDVAEFSAQSFSNIARSYFEKHPRRSRSSSYHHFQCSSCNLIFPTNASLQLHISLSEKSNTSCQKCKSDFSCAYDLNLHQKMQTSCSEQVDQNTDAIISQERFLSNLGLGTKEILNQERYKPAVKQAVFENYTYFVNAKPEENKATAINLPSKSDFVPLSPKEASVPPPAELLTPPSLPIAAGNNIIENGSKQSFLNNKNDDKKLSENSNISDSSSTTCPHCDLACENKATLHQHMLIHEERLFVCKICSYSFTTKANCERHIQKIHQIKKKDEIQVNVQYNISADFQDALNNEDGTTCKYCNKNFNTKKLLGRHKRSQEGCKYKPYKCKTCNLGFSSKNNYKRHCINKHSKDATNAKSLGDSISLEENSSDSDETYIAANETVDNAISENSMPLSFEKHSDQSITEELPLDLSAQPINLCLNQEASRDRLPQPTSIFTLVNFKKKDVSSCDIIIISSDINPSIPSMIHTPPVTPSKDNSPPLQESDESLTDQAKKHYTCSYCFAKFTLKSNMSRHIKKKHPGNARPSRSRNFIAAISQPAPINKISPSTASTETKIALRNSLLNKNNLLNKKETIIPGNESKSPVKVVKDNQPVIVEDLASVSVLINNANSQHFGQYLNQTSESPISNNLPPLSPLMDKDSNSALDSPEKKKNSYSSSPKRVQCTFCNRKFPWLSSLRRHLLTHTGQKPFQCPHCPVNFTTKSNCERHITKKHNQSIDNIRNTPERPFKCNLCPSSSFSNQINLQKHMVHKHGCENDQYNLLIKEESEDPEAKESESDINSGDDDMTNGDLTIIPCFHCSLSFSSKEDLEKHVENHADLFYKCHLCATFFKSFRYCLNHFEKYHPEEYFNLQKHEVIPTISPEDRGKIKVHSTNIDFNLKKVVCSICFYHCQSDLKLRNHMTTHNQDIYPCDVCNKKFESFSFLAKHKEKFHGNRLAVPGPSKLPIQPAPTYLIGNSLLPIISKKLSDTIKLPGNALPTPISSDLIQNLLCLPDSIKIDELLAKNPDSAAEILGVVTSK